jgi:hypothetical protein
VLVEQHILLDQIHTENSDFVDFVACRERGMVQNLWDHVWGDEHFIIHNCQPFLFQPTGMNRPRTPSVEKVFFFF